MLRPTPDRFRSAPAPEEGGRPRLRLVGGDDAPASRGVAPAPVNPTLPLPERLQLRAASLTAQSHVVAGGHLSSGLDEILASTAALLQEAARALAHASDEGARHG